MKEAERRADRSGPASAIEAALRERLRVVLAPLLPAAAAVAATLEAPSRADLGDFRFDVTAGGGAPPARDVHRAVAAAVGALDGVASVAPTRSWMYLRLDARALSEIVVPAVLDAGPRYGSSAAGAGRATIVTFSDPNLNKPLHVGHLRNNALGMSIAALLEHCGHPVERQAVHSDWGIHIAQAVVAYRRWGGGRTPEDAGVKGDHFVGDYYARFHAEQHAAGGASADTEADAESALDASTPLLREGAELLRQAEDDAGSTARALTERLTGWCEAGVQATYTRIGTRLDTVFRERDALADARRAIDRALAAGRCRRRSDGSIFVPLAHRGLPDLTLVRRDGTPVVYAQWLGVDLARHRGRTFETAVQLAGYEWKAGQMQYMAALDELGFDWVSRWEHIHYGMVRLPTGKMSSRAGAVVSADALLDTLAARLADGWSMPPGVDRRAVCDRFAVAVAKYFLLRGLRKHELRYDEQTLLRDGMAGFGAVVRMRLRADAESRASAPRADDVEVVPLLLHLAAFQRAVWNAARRREPAIVVRHLDALCAQAARVGSLGPRLARAIGVVVDVALALLDIELPDPMNAVPPLLRDRSAGTCHSAVVSAKGADGGWVERHV